MFEIHTMDSKIHDNVDLLLDVKSLIEFKVEMSIRELKSREMTKQKKHYSPQQTLKAYHAPNPVHRPIPKSDSSA